MNEENPLDLFEPTEHLRAQRDSVYNRESYAYLPAFRLFPVVLLCMSWVAIDTWLYTWNEALANFAQLGAYFLACLGIWLIQVYFYEPRYDWPLPVNNSLRDQLRYLPKLLVLLAGVGGISAAGVFTDSVFVTSVSFTLLAVGVLLVVWWGIVGTKGGLFHAGSDFRLQELSFPLRRKIWELVCRHYHLVLATIVALTSLVPVTGLVDSDFFADSIVLYLTLSLLITICMLFDERHLRQHHLRR